MYKVDPNVKFIECTNAYKSRRAARVKLRANNERIRVRIYEKCSVVPFESIQSSLELKTPVARIVSLQTTPLYSSWYPVPGNKTQRTIFNIRFIPLKPGLHMNLDVRIGYAYKNFMKTINEKRVYANASLKTDMIA